MDQAKAKAILTRGKVAGNHLALVALSFFPSFFVIQGVGLMPGEAIDFMICGFLLFHALAAVVGILIHRVSVRSCIMVFAIAFLPGSVVGIAQIQQAIYLRYYAPYDRFEDYLASPVPESVSNLSFVWPDDQIHANLMLRFDINPADMDAILKRLDLERVEPSKMLNPTDFFQYPHYMPIPGRFHLYQGKDKFDEVLTIKTNVSHSHVIFRRESSNFYRDRWWETGDPTILQMDHDALERLKRHVGK